MAFHARYPGHCATCGQPFDAGEMIESSFGKGYSHAEHDRTSMAVSVTLREPVVKRRGGVERVADGCVGTCEKCGAVAIVNTVYALVGGRRKPKQVCSRCHTELVTPSRSLPG